MKLYKTFLTFEEIRKKQANKYEQSRMIFPIQLEILVSGVLKDAKDTFKPYKHWNYLLRDLILQPIYGILNITLGIFNIAFSPFSLLALFATPFVKNKKDFPINVLKDTGITFTKGTLSVARGITQILAWPLTILRTPIRSMITWVKGRPKLEDSKGIKKLVKKYERENDSSHKKIIALTLVTKTRRRLPWQKSVLPEKNRYEHYIQNFPQTDCYEESSKWTKADADKLINFFQDTIKIRDQEKNGNKAILLNEIDRKSYKS